MTLIYAHEQRNVTDRPDWTARVFHRIYPNGNQSADFLLFTVNLKRKTLPFHFITSKCNPEQCRHSHIPADLWRKQPVAGDAGRGMPCTDIERDVFA